MSVSPWYTAAEARGGKGPDMDTPYPGITFSHFESIESSDADAPSASSSAATSAPDVLSDHYYVGEPSNHGNDRTWAKNVNKEWGRACQIMLATSVNTIRAHPTSTTPHIPHIFHHHIDISRTLSSPTLLPFSNASLLNVSPSLSFYWVSNLPTISLT
jgi:hypothetical protein